MISIVLIEPEHPGNIGAICRAMKNFDLQELIIINPKCSPTDQEAKNRAKFANDILEKAKVKDFSFLKTFNTLIATTSQLGTDYNIPRSPITPEQLTNILPKSKKTAILFGREGIGLKNKEIEMCDFVVTIPTSKKYPTMNLSQSAVILFYELFKGRENITSHINPITKAEKEQLMKMLNKTLNKMQFATPSKKQTQLTVWKKIIGKSFLSKREAYALMGFFKKLI